MIIGITGGIGSGKSVFSKIVRALGYCVYDSDKRAKEIMVQDGSVVMQIKSLLGENAYIEGGEDGKIALNREFVASKIFNDKGLLLEINRVVHPAVKRDIDRWAEAQGVEILFVESAILIESDFIEFMDYSINIESPLELRVKRVVARDGANRESVLQRISNQLSNEERREKCDYTILCNDKDSLIDQTLELVNLICLD